MRFLVDAQLPPALAR